MGKQSGLGDNFYLDGYDLSGDVQLYEVGGGFTPIDMTGIDKSAYERVGGLRDGRINWTSFYNDDTSRAHPVLKVLPYTDRIGTVCRGTILGNPAASLVAKQVNYDPTRGADGSLLINVQALGNAYGLEWGRQLTAGKRTDTAATDGSSVDLLTASPGAFGAQFYLHVFAFTGTDLTIKVQESSDNAVGDPFADVVGGGFTAVTTAPVTQRIATAAINVERYLRVKTTTVGGVTSCTFAVMAIRNDTAVVF